MTVEALIFMVLGLLAVGFILKAAAGGDTKRKSDKRVLEKEVLAADAGAENGGGNDIGNGNGNGNGNDHSFDPDVITKELETLHSRQDAAPTAELQAIGDVAAMRRAQILVDKGQIIEAVEYLRENAGYDMKTAVEAVDSLGRKVYPSD